MDRIVDLFNTLDIHRPYFSLNLLSYLSTPSQGHPHFLPSQILRVITITECILMVHPQEQVQHHTPKSSLLHLPKLRAYLDQVPVDLLSRNGERAGRFQQNPICSSAISWRGR